MLTPAEIAAAEAAKVSEKAAAMAAKRVADKQAAAAARAEEQDLLLAQRERDAEATLLAAEQLRSTAVDTASSTGSTVGTNNGLSDRERRLIEREEAAIEAMRAAEQLVQETTNRAPQVKVNMDVPLLDECPTFEQYDQMIEMWVDTTDIDKRKLGSILFMSIPVDSTKYGDDLRQDLFDNVNTKELTNNVNGVSMIMTYLRKRVGRNKREAMIETFVSFLKYQRRVGQSIEQYILEFERHYKQCKMLNIFFHDNVSAFLLLYNASLKDIEYKLLKGVINIEEDEGRLYIKVKAKLSEMMTNSMGDVVNPQGNIGNEVLLAHHKLATPAIQQTAEEVLYAQGWRPTFKPNKYQKGKPTAYTKSRPTTNYKTNSNQATPNNRPTNPKGSDGEIMKCHSCQSIRHLINNCPDAHENKKGKKTIRKEVYYIEVNSSDSESEREIDQNYDQNYEEEQSYQPTIPKNTTNRIVLVTNDATTLCRFTSECLNHGALDTCCTSCVCGIEWLEIYLKALTPELREKVKGPIPSKKQFMFGNQGTLTSAATYHIPIKIGGHLKMLEIDCIKSDIPLLISMSAMKDLKMVLDLKHDQVTVDNTPIPVIRTTAGHYAIDLLGGDQMHVDQICMVNTNQDNEQVNLVDLATADEKTQTKLLLKLHKQFGHRPKAAFVSLLKSADKWQEHFSPMLDKIISSCEGCIMRKRAPDKPIVCLPMANDFNQVVTMDLKIWDMNKKQYILYIIDWFTRYTVATVINRKTPDQVINAIFEKWIQYFGHMDKIMTDNGGEFTNDEMTEVSNRLNLKLFTTGAESPWQNGLCERNHAHTDNILQSVLRDYPELSLKSALTWACTAKNSLTNIHGYNPFQLVFGRNIRLPNILNDPPPTYEIKTKSKALRDNLTALHATREAYMKAESCERLKKALKHRIRTFEHTYEHGDYVYYKRERQDAWEGPARVVFQDNKVILVRHGGFFYKVSANRLLPAHSDLVDKLKIEQLKDQTTAETTSSPMITRSNAAPPAITIAEVEQENPTPIDQDENQETQSEQPTNDIDNNLSTPDQDSDTEDEMHDTSDISANDDNNITNDVDSDSSEDEFEDAQEPAVIKIKAAPSKPVKTRIRPKPKQPIRNNKVLTLHNKDRIEIKENNAWERGIVVSKAGKSTGKYSTWYNIKLDNGKEFSTDIKHRDVRKLTTEEAMATWVTHEVFAVMVPRADRNNDACQEAKDQELSKLKEFDTYQVVEDQNQDRITTTWVLTEKADIVKARLTCKGFQEEDDFPTDSPTVQKSSIRLLLTLATTFLWAIQTIDIKSAFLQGDKLTRKVFVKPPKEANLKNKLWRLKKCLYGLKDASRQWYLRLKKTLLDNSFQRCKYDGALFYLIKDSKLIGLVGVHVDDFLCTGDDNFMTNIIPKVLEKFVIGKAEDQAFMYTGFKLDQDSKGITLDQTDYVENLTILDLDIMRLRQKVAEMTQNELTALRMYAGSINWAVGISRPDLSFDMISLSTQFKGGKVSALKQAHSVMKSLKKSPAYVRLSNLGDMNNCELWVFSDAAHRNLNNNTDSAGGYIIFIVNIKDGNCSPIEWRSNKIKRKVASTLAAEMLALSSALEAAISTRDQIYQLTAGKIQLKIKAITDNKSARDAIYSEKSNDQKRLRAEIAAIKEMIETEQVREIKWVAGEFMLADILTKKGVKRHSLMSVIQTGQIEQNFIKMCS